jgi:hypothetical protein
MAPAFGCFRSIFTAVPEDLKKWGVRLVPNLPAPISGDRSGHRPKLCCRHASVKPLYRSERIFVSWPEPVMGEPFSFSWRIVNVNGPGFSHIAFPRLNDASWSVSLATDG